LEKGKVIRESFAVFLINLMMLIISPLESLPLVRGKEIKVINMLKVITSGRREG